jgi:AbrB family looped-hinge helix DNA binding protein
LSGGEIIKVTSKGQITIPAKIRRALSLDRDSYLYLTRAGRLLVMRKVDELSLDEISAVLEAVAEERGVTRELLFEEAEKARERLMEERDVGA